MLWDRTLRRKKDAWDDFIKYLDKLDTELLAGYDVANTHEEFLRIQLGRRQLQRIRLDSTREPRDEQAEAERKALNE